LPEERKQRSAMSMNIETTLKYLITSIGTSVKDSRQALDEPPATGGFGNMAQFGGRSDLSTRAQILAVLCFGNNRGCFSL